jgi:tetratricopeptide (TPR) repeat protein
MVGRDPLYRPAIQNLLRRYFANGRIEDARKLLEKVQPYFTNEAWIKTSEADQLRWEGKMAEALALSRSASEAYPNDATSRFFYELNLWNMRAYRELLDIDTRFFKAASLNALGRTEEATILAYKDAASGDFGGLINLLSGERRHAELIEFIESRWGNLDAFQEDSPGLGGFGYMQMARIAHAYRATENEPLFQDALERLDQTLTHLRAQGANNPPLLWSEAYLAMLEGDETTALDRMELILQSGIGLNPDIARNFPVFEPLRGDERFEAIQASMRQKIDGYREQAGLPSLEEESI